MINANDISYSYNTKGYMFYYKGKPDNKFDFGGFGSDSISNCYHYINIIDDIIKIKPSYIIAIDKDKYWVETEEFRWDIQKSLEREFTKENQK